MDVVVVGWNPITGTYANCMQNTSVGTLSLVLVHVDQEVMTSLIREEILLELNSHIEGLS